MHLGSPFSHPARVNLGMRQLRGVYKIVAPFFVHVPAYGAAWGFAVASDTLNPRNVSAAEIDARLNARQIGDRRFYEGDTHRAMFAVPPYIRELLGRVA
jgi:spermidine synthase